MTQRPNGSIFALTMAVPCGLVAAAIALWAMSASSFLALLAGVVVGGVVFWLLARGDAPVAQGTAPPTSAAQTDQMSDDSDTGAAAASPGAAAVAPAAPQPDPAPEPDPVPDPTPMPKPTPEATAAAGEEAGGDGGDATGTATKPEMRTAPKAGGADDLKQIKGIGPKLEELLNSMGIYHFDQIASWTAAEVAWLDENLQGFKGRVSRDDWVAQARTLARGEATAFSDKVKKGDVY